MSNKSGISRLNTVGSWLIGLEFVVLFLFLVLFFFPPDFLNFIVWNIPQLKWLYIISPVLTAIYIWNSKWKTKAIFRWHQIDSEIYGHSEDASFGKILFQNSVAKFVLLKLAVIFFIISLIGPKSGGEMKETTSEGVELMVALDVSKSMLAEDIPPNRLYVAKSAIKNTIKELQGDLLGLVVFAGNAYTQMPLSNDYAAAQAYLENINTSTVPTQGTSISAAILECSEGFNMESNASKIILIFTDGEDHEEEIQSAIDSAKEKGIKVSCVAMGSETGAPIPDYSSDGKYKKDAQGSTIITKANAPLMKQIAKQGNGFYTRIGSSQPREINQVVNYVKGEQTAETGNFVFVDLTPRFRIPLSIALLLLIASFLIKEKDSSWF